jgi:hypothetical protein
MGSNIVGGGFRKTRKSRKGRKTRKHRGAGWFDCASTSDLAPSNNALTRPYVADVYPNILQRASQTWSGATPNNYPAPSPPEDKTWSYQSTAATGINPKLV